MLRRLLPRRANQVIRTLLRRLQSSCTQAVWIPPDSAGSDAPPRSYAPRAAITVAVGIAMFGCGASASAAQSLPYWLQITPSARIDLIGYVPSTEAAALVNSQKPFAAPQISTFLDIFAGNHVYLLGEVRADRGEAPADQPFEVRIEQLYLRITPSLPFELSVQAGKFVTPFGNWPQRHNSSADPFIRPPLNYDYRTLVTPAMIPRSNDGFIDWKDEPDIFRPAGAPIVWAAPYQVGMLAFGAWRKLAWRFAVMNSAPSSEPHVWDPDFNQAPAASYVAHLGYQLAPALRIGLSWNSGPYLDRTIADSLLARGHYPADHYDQTIWGAELTYSRGLADLRAEVLLDSWDVPAVTEYPKEVAYYVEGKLKLAPGFAAAARFGSIVFNRIPRDNGTPEKWDYDIHRAQLGIVYRYSQRIELKTEYMLNHTTGPRDPSDNLFAVQASVTF